MTRRQQLSALMGSILVAGFAAPALAQAPPAKAPADWVDEVKHPVDWLSWGFDFRAREVYIENHLTLNEDLPNDIWHFERFRARLWGTVEASENIDINGRLVWEGRHWWQPDSRENWDWSDVIPDQLNVRATLPEANTVVTVGRQDIIMGDGWLVLDGTPLDGSRTIFFDAVRSVTDFKDINTKLDLIYLSQFSDPDEWLGPINSVSAALTEQDERGAVVQLAHQIADATQVSEYFIYKHMDAVAANGDDGELYTFGGRLLHGFNPNIKWSAEGAYQFGHLQNVAMFGSGSEDVSAFGAKTQLAYLFNDNWKNQVYVGYEFLSGDDPDSDTIEQFNPLWGRWPQWSELYIYTYAIETRIADVTNLHRLTAGWQGHPTNKMEIRAAYHALFADENTFEDRAAFGSGDFRGHLITSVLRYRFNRFLSGHLVGEYFMPGDYYADDRDDDAVFLRAELMFTF